MYKKALLGVIMITLLGLAGWWECQRFLVPDPRIEAELEAQFGPGFFQDFSSPAARTDVPPTGSVAGRIQARISPPAQGPSPGQFGAAPAVTSTEREIVDRYVPQLQALEGTANGRLEALFTAALQEYRRQKQEGRLDVAELARKYLQAGYLLEANIDGQVEGLLDRMEADLVANQQPTSIVGEIRADYDAAKAKKRAELLARARR